MFKSKLTEPFLSYQEPISTSRPLLIDLTASNNKSKREKEFTKKKKTKKNEKKVIKLIFSLSLRRANR